MRQENKRGYSHRSRRPADWQILEAVRLYEEEGWTLEQIGKKFNRAPSGIHRWITKFAKEIENPDMSKKTLRGANKKKHAKRLVGTTAPETTPRPSIVEEENLEQKVKRLERELADARLARDFYNEMINVAEKQFNIDIRKKAGTRQ